MNVLPACISVHHCVLCTYRGQKQASESLELELQITVSCHVGAGKLNLVPQEKQVLLTTEPSFHPSLLLFLRQGL